MSQPISTYCASKDCGHPVDGTTLCTKCSDLLIQHLAEMPWVYDQLRIVLTKQARFSRGNGGSRSTEIPLTFNTGASDTMHALARTLTRWQARMADHAAIPVRYPNPITASQWMLTAVTDGKATTWVDAGHMLDDLADARSRADEIIYGPKERWFAGTCSMTINEGVECDAELYADSDTGTITCQRCGNTHDVANRRAILLKYAEDTFATATEAARAVVVWSDYERGENRLVKRIGMWAERRRITQRGTLNQDGKDRPLYRIGDILDLLAADTRKQAS